MPVLASVGVACAGTTVQSAIRNAAAVRFGPQTALRLEAAAEVGRVIAANSRASGTPAVPFATTDLSGFARARYGVAITAISFGCSVRVCLSGTCARRLGFASRFFGRKSPRLTGCADSAHDCSRSFIGQPFGNDGARSRRVQAAVNVCDGSRAAGLAILTSAARRLVRKI